MALKIYKRFDEIFLQNLRREIEIHSSLIYLNIIRLLEMREGVNKLNNQFQVIRKNIAYSVMEIAEGGCIFDYIAKLGKIDERFAKYVFRYIIDGNLIIITDVLL